MNFIGMHLLGNDLVLFCAYCVMVSLHSLKEAFFRFGLFTNMCMLAMDKLKINYDQIAMKKYQCFFV